MGNSNTRWHWGTVANSPEPAIPWDAWLFPDGTPVSLTEAGALRRYVTRHDEFLAYEDFLPKTVSNGDQYADIEPGGHGWEATMPAQDSFVAEASLWFTAADSQVALVLKAQNPSSLSPRPEFSLPTLAGSSSLSPPRTCNASTLYQDTDACSGGPAGYRDLDVSGATDPVAACDAACCQWRECTAWVLRNESEMDHNCSAGSVCCWLKPNCPRSQADKRPGCLSGYMAPSPPGPPFRQLDGYYVTVDAKGGKLEVTRRSGINVTLLASFDTRTLENGIVMPGWNMLRAAVVLGSVTVWFNPMYPETGFVGNSTDSARVPRPLPPRIEVTDPHPLPAGGLAMLAGVGGMRLDYVSALPISALPHPVRAS